MDPLSFVPQDEQADSELERATERDVDNSRGQTEREQIPTSEYIYDDDPIQNMRGKTIPDHYMLSATSYPRNRRDIPRKPPLIHWMIIISVGISYSNYNN